MLIACTSMRIRVYPHIYVCEHTLIHIMYMYICVCIAKHVLTHTCMRTYASEYTLVSHHIFGSDGIEERSRKVPGYWLGFSSPSVFVFFSFPYLPFGLYLLIFLFFLFCLSHYLSFLSFYFFIFFFDFFLFSLSLLYFISFRFLLISLIPSFPFTFKNQIKIPVSFPKPSPLEVPAPTGGPQCITKTALLP